MISDFGCARFPSDLAWSLQNALFILQLCRSLSSSFASVYRELHYLKLPQLDLSVQRL